MNSKQTPRTRLLAISGATLALVLAGGAVASAHPSDGRGRGGPDMAGQMRGRDMDRLGQGMDGLGLGRGPGAGMRGALIGPGDSVVRRETMVQTADGVVTDRVDHGTAMSATETAFEYTLATGETVEVSVDEDTQVIAFSDQTVDRGRRSGTRMLPTEITLAEIEAGSEVGVWSTSPADGSFVAERIVVRPTDSTAAAGEVVPSDADASAADAADVAATDA